MSDYDAFAASKRASAALLIHRVAVRAEASHRWSSVRGWERAYRVDADAEVTPIALNDRPLALFALVTAASTPDIPQPELRIMAGLRLSQPLR